MKKIRDLLNKILIYSWQASPLTFSLLVVTSIIFALVKFYEIAIFEALIDKVNAIYRGTPFDTVFPTLIAFGLLLIVTPFLELIEFLVRGYFWRRGHGFMQSQFHERVGRKDLIDFEDHQAFDHMKRASLGTSETPNNIRVMIQILFLYLPFFLVVAYYLFTIHPILMLVLLLISIPLILAEVIKVNENFAFENDVASLRRKIDYYDECITHKSYIKDTMRNNGFDFFLSKLLVAMNDYILKHRSMYLYNYKTSLKMNTLNIIGYTGVISLLLYFLWNGQISVSEFAAVYYAIDKVSQMLKRLISDLGDVLSEMATSVALIDFLDYQPKEENNKALNKNVDIHLNNVSFTYPKANRFAVKNINLTIPRGTTLAIVGENGSGKSTLSKLILGLYQPELGKVLYGQDDLNAFSKGSRFKNSSAVFQDFSKYKLNVEDNIKISEGHIDKDVRQILEDSHFNICQLSNGSLTTLSREFGGQDLSGGEWQRLAIARGLYRGHQIIVLDEPTAAIDPIEECNIFNTFKQASQDKTSILVSHRLGSVQLADLIIVMDQGKLVEKGTHQALMNQRGLYYDMFKSQAKWYQRIKV